MECQCVGLRSKPLTEKTSDWVAASPQSANPLAELVDEMHLAYAPVLLGWGECLLAGMDLPALGYQGNEHVATVASMHVVMAKKQA
ncbi:MAG: hypothetical protein WB762_10315 [Candidatus Sulfotelmatobacter sp.]